MITYKKGDVCLDNQRKIWSSHKILINKKIWQKVLKNATFTELHEIRCSLLLACYCKYSSGNCVSEKSKAKLPLMENSLF